MLQRLIASRCRANVCLLLGRRGFVSFPNKPNHGQKIPKHQDFIETYPTHRNITRLYHGGDVINGPLSEVTYNQVCEATLDSLCEHFEELVEKVPHLVNSDVALGDGVLTIQFGAPYGTYVINRQRPNLQIWLSSPTSGPKRYDFVNGQWIYKRDGLSLHQLLEQEIKLIVKNPIDLTKCAYA